MRSCDEAGKTLEEKTGEEKVGVAAAKAAEGKAGEARVAAVTAARAGEGRVAAVREADHARQHFSIPCATPYAAQPVSTLTTRAMPSVRVGHSRPSLRV